MLKKIIIPITGLLVGFLLASQYIAYKRVHELVVRDSTSNIFGEIQFHKKTNESLAEEINNLQNQKEQISNRYLAQQAIMEEIKNDEMLLGKISVQGPGVEININRSIAAIWLVDLANELWTAGAEAISINNIRLTNKVSGLENVNDNQVIINGSLIPTPLIIRAIGENKLIDQALSQGGGITARLKTAYPDIKIEIIEQETVEM